MNLTAALQPYDRATGLDWMKYRACDEFDAELFFPRAKDKVGTAQAVQVCAGCPVRLLCLQNALDSGSRYGVWGGVGELDRVELHDQAERGRQRSAPAWRT